MLPKLLICYSWDLNNHLFMGENSWFPLFLPEKKEKSHLHGANAEPKCVNGFHFWSPNVSMAYTFGAQTHQSFPHLEPKRVNGFHIWSPNMSMVSKTISVKSRSVSSQCGNHWRVWAPNVETIDACGLQMWKPLTHLGSQSGNHWHI